MAESVSAAATWGRRVALGLLCLILSPLLLALLVVALPFLAVGHIFDKWRRQRLRREFEARWAPSGKHGLLIYSNSPHWQRYIEEHWLPRLEQRLVVLNWSERQQWPERYRLEGEIVRRYLGEREFNPAAVVFPTGGDVQLVRFWHAFRDFKHGKDRALRAAEAELFDVLERPTGVGA